MNSRKMLELLKQRIICAKGEKEFDLLYKKYYEEIKKDLEVLEIIKKHSFLNLSVLADYDISEFDEYFDDWYNTTNELDRKEFELLKEWLENEQIT